MSASRIVVKQRPRILERCALCFDRVDDFLIHLATRHPGVERRAEIFWLNKHEAVYAGKHYRRAE